MKVRDSNFWVAKGKKDSTIYNMEDDFSQSPREGNVRVGTDDGSYHRNGTADHFQSKFYSGGKNGISLQEFSMDTKEDTPEEVATKLQQQQ